jgi:hypothetical protein
MSVTRLRSPVRKVSKPTADPRPAEGPHAVFVWFFAACLAGSLLFAHGCHREQDDELFGMWIAWIPVK